MRHAVIAGTFALALAPFAATAGGVAPTPAPAPAPIPAPTPVGTDWTGFYAGVQVEYGDVSAENGPLDGAAGDGALYGFFGGYRYDLGDFVIGAEVDFNLADIDLAVGGANVGNLEAVHRYGLEAGFDAGPALIYGTGGVAQAYADTVLGEFDDTGYYFGAGVDYLVTDQIIIGAEILQHEFEDFDSTGSDISATTFGINAAFRF